MKRLSIIKTAALAVMLSALLAGDARLVGAAPVASGPTWVRNFTASGEVLTAVALNAAAGTRTLTFDALEQQFSKVRVQVFYTYSAATTVTAAWTCSIDGTNYASDATESCASGTCTHYAKTDTYTTGAANASISFDFDARTCRKAKVVLGGASAGAGDLVTTDSAGVVGL